ncbi:MAG TPA: hypothetical protein PLS66_06940 [Tepiditoga sp.]|nr:hypothetical protein [Tepiditoga sp.]
MLKAPKNYWKDFFSVLSEKKIIKNINAEILAEEFFSYQVSILFEYVIIKDTDSVFSEEIKNKLFTHIDFFCSAI